MDGTVCTDFEEPSPWAAIDAVGCELRDIAPAVGQRYAKGPVMTFSGRGRVPSSYRVAPYVSAVRRATESEFLAAYRSASFGFTLFGLEASCDGRSRCSGGPLTAFTDDPSTPADALEIPSTQAPPPFWLYVAVFDRTRSRLYSLAERPVNCPAFVPLASR